MPEGINFFHSFDYPETINGVASLALLKQYADVIFTRHPVSGRTVVDIGAWEWQGGADNNIFHDGFNPPLGACHN